MINRYSHKTFTNYSEDAERYLLDNINMDIDQLKNEMKQRFGIDLSYSAIRHKILRLTDDGTRVIKRRHSYTKEQKAWLRENVEGVPYDVILDRFNKTFGTNITKSSLDHIINRQGLKNGIDNHYKKGKVPENKRPLYSVSFRKELHKGSLWCIKLKEDGDASDWYSMHRFIWEKNYGAIPKGMCIVFKDRNPWNCRLDNLIMVSKSEFHKAFKKGLTEDADINECMFLIEKLGSKIKERENG